MNRKHPLARKLATSALAMGIGLGVTAVVASPAQAADSCTLSIGPQQSGFNKVTLSVGCGNGVFGLYGADPLFDDFRGGPFFNGALVPGGVLNEDDDFFDREDEIYAIVAPTNHKTNTVVGRF